MLKKHRHIIFVICLTLVSDAWATGLLELYQSAESNDPQFLEVITNYRATLERKPQAWALLRPNITLSANTRYNDQDITVDNNAFGGSGDVQFNSRGYRLNLTQPIFRLNRIRSLETADLQIQQAATEIELARQELIIRLAERYFELLAANDNLDFANTEEESLKRQFEQAEQRFDVGLIAITDVQEARAGYDRAVAGKIRAQNAIAVAEENLREVVGEFEDVINVLNEEMPLLKPDPESISSWTDSALEQNLAIVSAQYTADITRQEIKVQSAEHYPTLDIVANHGRDTSGGRFGGTSTLGTTVGIELNVPLYSGGLVSSRVREAVELHESALHRLETSRRAAERQTRSTYSNVISGISEVSALKQALISTETALEATRAGFDVGTRTAVDVVTVERAVQDSRRNYANARYGYILDTLRLKQAAGTLNIDDLTYINNWLIQPSTK